MDNKEKRIFDKLPDLILWVFKIPFVGLYAGFTLFFLLFPIFLVWLNPEGENPPELSFFSWVRVLNRSYPFVFACVLILRFIFAPQGELRVSEMESIANLLLSAYLITNLVLGFPFFIYTYFYTPEV